MRTRSTHLLRDRPPRGAALATALAAFAGLLCARAAHGELPAAPSRYQILQAMNAVAPAVRRCAAAGPPVVVVVTFAGSGAVRAVGFSAPTRAQRSPAVLECVHDAVMTARVPSFQGVSFQVSYPFISH